MSARLPSVLPFDTSRTTTSGFNFSPRAVAPTGVERVGVAERRPREREGNREQNQGAQDVEEQTLQTQARRGSLLAAQHELQRGERHFARAAAIEQMHQQRDEGRERAEQKKRS